MLLVFLPVLYSTTLSTPCNIPFWLLSSKLPVPCVHITALLCCLFHVHKFSKILDPEGDMKAVPYRVCTNTRWQCTHKSTRIWAPLLYTLYTLPLFYCNPLYFISFKMITHVHSHNSFISQIIELFTTCESI